MIDRNTDDALEQHNHKMEWLEKEQLAARHQKVSIIEFFPSYFLDYVWNYEQTRNVGLTMILRRSIFFIFGRIWLS